MHPNIPAGDGPIFWTPIANPGNVIFTAAPNAHLGPLNSNGLAARDIRSAEDGVYQTITAADGVFAAIILGRPAPNAPLAATILLDGDTPDRIEAIARFWSAWHRRSMLADARLTPQRRQRLKRMLRAVDAHLEHTSYRAIAAVLFPQHQIDAASWAGNALRETTIRLVRDGMKLVNGGYRSLLRRPRRRS